jgi:hypothetical protein
MFNFWLFNFRSPARDRESDETRLALIQQTVRSAITNAERELNGVRARLESARRSASLVANTRGLGGEATDLQPRTVEERLVVGEKRIVQLKEHLAGLRRMESTVTDISHPEAVSFASALAHPTLWWRATQRVIGKQDRPGIRQGAQKVDLEKVVRFPSDALFADAGRASRSAPPTRLQRLLATGGRCISLAQSTQLWNRCRMTGETIMLVILFPFIVLMAIVVLLALSTLSFSQRELNDRQRQYMKDD